MAYSSSDFVSDIDHFLTAKGLIHNEEGEDCAQAIAEQAIIAVTALLEIKELAAKLATATLSGRPPEEIAALASKLQTMTACTRPQYLVATGWGHCFVGSQESTTRWVIDLEAPEISIVKAQVLSGARWEDLSEDEQADLRESLVANEVRLAAVEFGLEYEWELPDWAEEEQAHAPVPRA